MLRVPKGAASLWFELRTCARTMKIRDDNYVIVRCCTLRMLSRCCKVWVRGRAAHPRGRCRRCCPGTLWSAPTRCRTPSARSPHARLRLAGGGSPAAPAHAVGSSMLECVEVAWALKIALVTTEGKTINFCAAQVCMPGYIRNGECSLWPPHHQQTATVVPRMPAQPGSGRCCPHPAQTSRPGWG